MRGVLRLQRHGGQRPGPGRALPILPQRDLRRLGPCRDRRVRRAGILLQRLQAADASGPRAASSPRRRSAASPPNRTDIHFPRPRVVTITQPTETGQVYTLAELRALSATCRELGLAPAHGRLALRQRLREPRLQPGRHDLAGRHRRAVLRRHQERHACRRGGGVLRPAARGGFRLPLQAGRPARLEDAVPRRPLGRHAGERRVAERTPPTAMPAPGVSPRRSPGCRGCGRCSPWRPTRSS